MTVLSSTQHPSEVQAIVAEVLGIPFNHVIVQCKRMGGGFGGKETQAAQPAAMAAWVAQLTGRPARIVLDRDTDMAMTASGIRSWPSTKSASPTPAASPRSKRISGPTAVARRIFRRRSSNVRCST